MSDTLAIYDYQNSSGIAVGDDTPVSDSFFNLGSVLRETTEDISFIVRNQSLTYQAVGVTITTIDIGTPLVSISDQLLFSQDDLYFAKVLSLGTIPPGASTLPITLRRATSSNAVSGNYEIKLQATAWV